MTKNIFVCLCIEQTRSICSLLHYKIDLTSAYRVSRNKRNYIFRGKPVLFWPLSTFGRITCTYKRVHWQAASSPSPQIFLGYPKILTIDSLWIPYEAFRFSKKRCFWDSPRNRVLDVPRNKVFGFPRIVFPIDVCEFVGALSWDADGKCCHGPN